MSDIVDELRSLPEPQCKPCNEAADAIEWLRAEVARLRLTDAEREAVRFSATAALPETEKLGGVAGELCRMHAATLRGLLERTKGGER